MFILKFISFSNATVTQVKTVVGDCVSSKTCVSVCNELALTLPLSLQRWGPGQLPSSKWFCYQSATSLWMNGVKLGIICSLFAIIPQSTVINKICKRPVVKFTIITYIHSSDRASQIWNRDWLQHAGNFSTLINSMTVICKPLWVCLRVMAVSSCLNVCARPLNSHSAH